MAGSINLAQQIMAPDEFSSLTHSCARSQILTMPSKLDLTGMRYGRLLVLCGAENDGPFTRWNCICDCGNSVIARTNALRTGHTSSCGCLKTELDRAKVIKFGFKHGGSTTEEYRSWRQMKRRCLDPKSIRYARYGGRGITVCERWLHSFPNFLADMGPKPAGFTIERLNNDLGYFPENCIWADNRTQAKNQTHPNACPVGELKPKAMELRAAGMKYRDIALELGISYGTARKFARGDA